LKNGSAEADPADNMTRILDETGNAGNMRMAAARAANSFRRMQEVMKG